MSKPLIFPTNPTFSEFQQYIKDMVVARGFSDETPQELFVLLLEEMGELARSARKRMGMKMADDTSQADLADEFADCLMYLTALANHFDVDLLTALKNKEAKNQKRTWK